MKTASGKRQFQLIGQPWHVEKTCRGKLEQISAEGCDFQFLRTIARTNRDLYVPTHISNCSPELIAYAKANPGKEASPFSVRPPLRANQTRGSQATRPAGSIAARRGGPNHGSVRWMGGFFPQLWPTLDP